MSQPRRKRRRRGRGGQSDAARKQQSSGAPGGNLAREQQAATPKKTRRRRGRGRGQPRQPAAAPSSEDLVRALPKDPPATLTAPPDGQSLETIIGELQSDWGVPQYPQEYRLTIKVAEDRDQRADQVEDAPRPTPAREDGDGPRREKAPAAPLMRMRSSDGAASGESATRKRRRGRRRRRRGGSGGGSATP